MKFLGPLLIGFAVAFVVGFGLTGLLSSAGVKNADWTVTWFPATFLGAFSAYIVGNLAGNRKVAAASDADRQAALTFAAPPGACRIYVVREGFVGKAAGLNVTLDGQPVTQLKAPRFTSVVTAPGRHVLGVGFGGLAGPQNTPAEEVLELAAGDVAAVRASISMGALKNTIRLERVPLDDTLRAKLARMTMVGPETVQA